MRTGTFSFGEQTHPAEWCLSSGTGARTFRTTVRFPAPPFDAVPQVAVALTGVDASNTANLRIGLVTEDVETHEFDLLVNTWADTIIFSISGVWVAE
jgi:hypothetical protein